MWHGWADGYAGKIQIGTQHHLTDGLWGAGESGGNTADFHIQICSLWVFRANRILGHTFIFSLILLAAVFYLQETCKKKENV